MNTLFQDAQACLQAQGGRMTSQRRLILETLEELASHPTAEELFTAVRERDPSLNLSTVYRTLRWLEQEGLVSPRRFVEDHRKERFDPVSSNEHYHFLCTACGTVIEFDYPLVETIKDQFETRHGAAIETTSIVLYGICRRCRE